MNASAVVVNNILAELDVLTSSAHNFARYKLPVDLDPESPSILVSLASVHLPSRHRWLN